MYPRSLGEGVALGAFTYICLGSLESWNPIALDLFLNQADGQMGFDLTDFEGVGGVGGIGGIDSTVLLGLVGLAFEGY